MNPLIALLVGIGWIVVKVLQTRKKDAESWGDLNEQPPAPRLHAPAREVGNPPRKIDLPGRGAMPPLSPVPSLARTLQRKPAVPASPPPLVQTASSPRSAAANQERGPASIRRAALDESRELYERTQGLDKAIANRLAAIEKETESAKPASVQVRTRSVASAHILRTMKHRTTARQAILASLVLNPPKALE